MQVSASPTIQVHSKPHGGPDRPFPGRTQTRCALASFIPSCATSFRTDEFSQNQRDLEHLCIKRAELHKPQTHLGKSRRRDGHGTTDTAAQTRLCLADRHGQAVRVTVLQEQLEQGPERAPLGTDYPSE